MGWSLSTMQLLHCLHSKQMGDVAYPRAGTAVHRATRTAAANLFFARDKFEEEVAESDISRFEQMSKAVVI